MSRDLRNWGYDNPAPATMMIISDGAEYVFGDTIAREQQFNKYNLFWAYSFRPLKMSILLTSAEWLWDSLLAGAFFFFLPLFYPLPIYIYITTELIS